MIAQMPSKKFGYERVSTKDQNEARQRESLLQMGIDERDIYTDKQSGKNFERPRYQLLKEMLREGDILYVHSLDRFGRNKEEILNEMREDLRTILKVTKILRRAVTERSSMRVINQQVKI